MESNTSSPLTELTSESSLEDRLAQLNDQVVTPEGFTRGDLDAAFTKVQAKQDWKGPIDAIVERREIILVIRAIEFFTGTQAKFEPLYGSSVLLRVRADGYRKGPAGDL